MTKRFYNVIYDNEVETIDELDSQDFKTHAEYKKELYRLRDEYQLAISGVYLSTRSTKEWREK